LLTNDQCEYRNVPDKDTSLFITRAMFATPWTAVSGVTWTSGREAVFSATGHTLVVGDFAWCDNAVSNIDQSAFKGVFRVTAVSGALVTVAIHRAPTAGTVPTASGWQIKKATENLHLEGGVWNFDVTNNAGATATNTHAIYFAGVANCTADVTVKDNMKYCFVTCADYRGRYTVRAVLSPGVVGSDIVKLYGPSLNVIARDVNGKNGDDAVSCQTKEPPAFASYQIAHGDILGAKVIDTTVDSAVANISGVVAYGSPGEMLNIEVDGIHGSINGAAFRVQAGDSITNAQVSSAVVKNVTALCRIAAQIGGGTGGMLQVGKVIVDRPVHNPLLTTDICVETKSTATVKHLIIEGMDSNVANITTPAWPSSTAVAVLLAGTVRQLTMNNPTMNGSRTNFRAIQVSAGATVNKINIDKAQALVNRMVNVIAGGLATPTINVTNSYIDSPAAVVCAGSANVLSMGNEFVGATSGMVQQSGGTVSLIHGANVLSGGSIVSSGTVSVTAL